MKKRVLGTTIGVLNLIMAVSGILLVVRDFLEPRSRQWMFSHPQVFILLAFTLLFLSLLAASGILLCRQRMSGLYIAIATYPSEIIYFWVTSILPIGAFFPDGNLGLAPQVITVFPIWALILTLWAMGSELIPRGSTS